MAQRVRALVLVLGGVAVGRGFEPQSDLEISFAEILIDMICKYLAYQQYHFTPLVFCFDLPKSISS
jgi:hypothetical protein